MKGKSRKPEGAIRPRFRLWLSSAEAEGVFGDGKWRLLAAIEREESLAAAAASLRMSYRKAWGDLKKAEKCLGVRLIEKHRGGTGGGASRLTKAGRAWLQAYSRLRADVETAVDKAYARHFRGV
jgi:molybdate transport system regulatory protein